MTIHQARTFLFANAAFEGLSDAALEVLADTLARLNSEVSGDDKTASSPIVPADLVINWRRVKPLSLRCM